MYGEAERRSLHWYAWYLWADKRKKTVWCKTFAEMVSVTGSPETATTNVYYCLAAAECPGRADQRIAAKPNPNKRVILAAASLALAADVDFVGEKHPRAPADEAAALALIADFPIRPTLTLNSGNGLQAVWVLAEPVLFADDAAREDWARVAEGWGALIGAAGQARGYDLDAVHDLARVMRWPGSTNLKDPANPKPTRSIEFDPDRRPTSAEIRELVAAPGLLGAAAGVTTPAKPKAAPGPATPATQEAERDVPPEKAPGVPWEKFNALEQISDDFGDTIHHRRKDLAGKSLSSWDMSLADQLVIAGWSDREITATLAHHRERFGNKEKLPQNRPDYYRSTIKKAREQHQKQAAITDPAVGRDAKIGAIADKLDVPLANVQLITGPPGVYRLWVNGRCVEVPADRMLQQSYVAGRIFDLTKRAPKPIPATSKTGSTTWRDLANAIAAAAEEIEGDPEATLDGEIMGLIAGFTEDMRIQTVPAGQVLESADQPFTRDGRLWFRLDALRSWMRGNDLRWERKELLRRLRAVGAETVVHRVKSGKRGQTTKRFWGIKHHDAGEELPLD